MNPEYQQVCQNCGECCKSIILQVSKPDLPQEKINHIEFFKTRGLKILREFGRVMEISVPLDCPHLQYSYDEEKDKGIYSCDIYGDHPEVCKRFDGRFAPVWHELKCKLKESNA